VGPARPWSRARASYQRALRALTLADGPGAVDTDQRLPELVLAADEEAYADLRARALAPLDDLTPAARERLTATLRSWLLHQGRREAVAADLFVHPQTVRYRMGQLREIFGDDLDDPTKVRDLVLALG
jgi:DNA-binding PucR family transcriptional regulator